MEEAAAAFQHATAMILIDFVLVDAKGAYALYQFIRTLVPPVAGHVHFWVLQSLASTFARPGRVTEARCRLVGEAGYAGDRVYQGQARLDPDDAARLERHAARVARLCEYVLALRAKQSREERFAFMVI